MNFYTEHYWTDQEIVDQILAERANGLADDDGDDVDDFYYYHNQHT